MTSNNDPILSLCDNIITNLENDKISVSSSLLKCRKLAQLVGDTEAQQWLKYECEGYPKLDERTLPNDAFTIAEHHGRVTTYNQTSTGFTELASELEADIASHQLILSNYSSQGLSLPDNSGIPAVKSMFDAITKGLNDSIHSIKNNQKKLFILRTQYHDFAVQQKLNLQDAQAASEEAKQEQ